MPFATVIASGVMPACWKANHSPVRPAPVWISSMISSAPCCSVSSRAACEVALGQVDHARLALDRLDEQRRDAVVERRLERLDRGVDELHAGHHRQERLLHVGLAGEGERAHRAAVEGVGQGQDAGTRRSAVPRGAVQARELERGLVGLGSGVAEVHAAGIAGAGEALEPRRELELRRRREVVRDVRERRRLARDRLDERRGARARASSPRSRRGSRGSVGRRHPTGRRPRRGRTSPSGRRSCAPGRALRHPANSSEHHFRSDSLAGEDLRRAPSAARARR